MSTSAEPHRETDRRIRPREIAVALAVLVPVWAVGITLRDRVAVLWIALVAAVGLGLAAVVLHARHGTAPRVGHDVWLALPAAAAHLAVSYVAIPVATAIVPLIGEQADHLVLDAQGDLSTLVTALVAALCIAPLEEVFWRGTVQPTLGAGRSRLATVALTTVVFVGFHVPTLQLPLIAAAALGGVVWGWLRERTEGLAAPVLAHAVWTAAMVVVPPS